MAKKEKSQRTDWTFKDDEPIVFHSDDVDGSDRGAIGSVEFVMHCLHCGKNRSQWEPSKRKAENSKYCSDACKVAESARRVPIKKSVRQAVMNRDHNKCRYCGSKAAHLDHVVPLIKGGTNDESNLVAACAQCNCMVNDRAFRSFDDKRAWILRRRGIINDGRSIQTTNLPRRADWRAWVYGGMKSLKNRSRKS